MDSNNKNNIKTSNTEKYCITKPNMNKNSNNARNVCINDIEIQSMTILDLDSIKDILFTEFDDFWNYNIFKSELENENSRYIVAKLNNEIIGFAGIWLTIDEAHITNIVTKKTYRNQGIGSLLLENLIEICKNLETKISSITLEVNEENISAQNLYKKFNFEILGKRKKYYKENSAIIMTLYF